MNAALAHLILYGRRNIPVETITTDSAVPPILGGGPNMRFHYHIPLLLPGDELQETLRASVQPILSGNQFSGQTFQGIQDAFAYDVVFESERIDVTAKLVDPAKILSQVLDFPTRKEWRSEGPRPGVLLPTPRLEVTTLGNWAKVARQVRAVYYMDFAELQDLQGRHKNVLSEALVPSGAHLGYFDPPRDPGPGMRKIAKRCCGPPARYMGPPILVCNHRVCSRRGRFLDACPGRRFAATPAFLAARSSLELPQLCLIPVRDHSFVRRSAAPDRDPPRFLRSAPRLHLPLAEPGTQAGSRRR